MHGQPSAGSIRHQRKTQVARGYHFFVALGWGEFSKGHISDRDLECYKSLIPKHLWGQYDVPGWTVNGIEPWGVQPDSVGSNGNSSFVTSSI